MSTLSISDPFVALWQGVVERSGKAVPNWRDFTPAELAPFAQFLRVFDYTDETSPSTRLIGFEKEQAVARYEKTETPDGPTMADADQEIVRPFHVKATKHPCGLEIVRHFERVSEEDSTFTVTSTILPACDKEGRPVYLLCNSRANRPFAPASSGAVSFTLDRIGFLDIGFGVPEADASIGVRIGDPYGKRFRDHS